MYFSALQPFCHRGTPDILSRLSWSPINKKLKQHELLVRKSNMSLLDTSTNKQLLQKLKSKKFNDSVFYIQNLAIRQKEPVSEICAVTFSNFGNCIAFGPLWIRCLFYIWTTLLVTVDTFAVIISLHMRKYAILLHLAWLNGKTLGFTFFYFIPTKVELNSISSLWLSLLSTRLRLNLFSTQSTLLCTSATSYNCDATITFFLIAQ